MVYMGSKRRIAKYIVPIIQSYIDENAGFDYVEPFVGGANVIDKIKCENRIGYDNNKYLIALLNHIRDYPEDIPEQFSKEEYYEVKNNQSKYEDWYIGLVGFCSYGGKWWGGYAGEYKNKEKYKGKSRNKEILSNLKKQSPNLIGIEFFHKNFIDLINLKRTVIYCDPPYKGTTKYQNSFLHEKYYDWCRQMSKHNIVLCSEYWMPEDFECIWEKELTITLRADIEKATSKDKKVEKLFICRR